MRYSRNNRGVVIKYTLLIAALIVLVTGCAAGTEPRARGGGPYVEEIKPPVPRDTLLFNPADCIVR